MDALHERLRKERQRLRFSQAEFAALGGIQRRAQVHYEAGEREPDAGYLASIAKAGADVQYILTGEPGAGAASQASIDGEVLRETMVAIVSHASRLKLDAPGLDQLGNLAAIIYNRIFRFSAKQERRKALDEEVEHIFHILSASAGREKKPTASPRTRISFLVDRWIALEVQCWQAFVRCLDKVDRILGPLAESDFGPREERAEKARIKLKVKMLSAGLIGYDAQSIERYSPVEEETCVAWLEAECKGLKEHLDYLNRELSRAGQEPVVSARGKSSHAGQRRKRS